MIKYIEKRDGTIAKFNPKNIYNAIYQSAKASQPNGGVYVDVDNVLRLVVQNLEKRNQPTINIEIVQDTVEDILMGLGYFKCAKAYITYRNMRDAQRNLSINNINVESSVEEYISKADWRVNANANQGYSLGGMILNISGKVTANYWLNKIYPKEIGQAHRNGDFHIHDLDMLSIYCCGWSLRNVLNQGMNGIPGKIESNPPKHLGSALNQALNHLCCCQNEAAGAQAYSSFDTYMAPFVRKDNLSYKEVKQHLQEFIYNLNVPSRWGTQTPFTNLTFDWVCPEDLKPQVPVIGGEECDFTYGDLQKEMDMINKAYIEVMLEGDRNGRVFTFPIPTYNITPDFNWDSENSTLLFEMTAKYGLPYFQNFINSELKPNMIRSMCPLAPDTLVYVKVNGKRIEETIGNLVKHDNIEVLCLNKWYPAKLNKSVKQKTRMICTENGCTEMGIYHLQPVLRNGSYITVQAKELKVGDVLPHSYNDTIVEKKIIEINEGKERDDLYCFEVDSEENLFELKNGLITHNCRLQLDLRELLKRGNGLFGSAEQTGSIGVVTINCARLGYLFKGDKESLYKRLDYLMELARNSLELKRKTLKQNMDRGLYPYIARWLGTLRNHFSTIGVNGINEMIRNFTNDEEDITTDKGHAFAVEFLDHVRQNLLSYQSEEGAMYNLEATPAEGTTYRFAKEDKKRFPDIIQAGTESNPYYTNSSQLPVGYTDDPFEALEMQDDLQRKYTGGTVLHLYMNEAISSSDACKKIVKRALTNFRLPYITITPTFSICPIHGYIKGQHEFCPKCDAELMAKKNKS